MRNCSVLLSSLLGLGLSVFLYGCAGSSPTSSATGGTRSPHGEAAAAISIVPPGTYARRTQDEVKLTTAKNGNEATSKSPNGSAALRATEPALPTGPVAWLYASAPTKTYLIKTGVDASVNVRVWETFLRKYQIPYFRVGSVEALEKMQSGVLILPSTVVLGEREKSAIVNFRGRGGSVLSTWLTGVRNETGEWSGFDFMERTLDVRVVGNTEDAEDDNFIIVHGDNPVSHHLAAGTRVWTERVKDMLPLRLVGKHYAAQIMDWSRTFSSKKKTGVITFDERPEASGKSSRSVVLGYPEQVWLSADPKLIEAMAYNAVLWLLRQPEAYVAAWPHPYHGGFVLAVEAAEEVAEVDLDFAKKLEESGAKGTYYVLGENISKSAAVVKKLQARGHEIGYFGDKFEGFKNQSATKQATRLATMRKLIADAGVVLPANASFDAPMDSYDQTTAQLLVDGSFGSYIAFMDDTEARLPIFAKQSGDHRRPTVVLPRTQAGPEESIEEGDPEVGLQNFFDELTLSGQMGALSIIRIPAQSLLTEKQRGEVVSYLKSHRESLWLSTSSKVAQWWRDRSRVSARIEPDPKAPLLIVTVLAESSPKELVAIQVNLPYIGARLRLESPQAHKPSPTVGKVDAWRSAVLLDELAPGEYRWYLHFDPPATSEK
ncbi:MAG: polysaccharide deacetylase family protein [Sulfuriferula multivorans]|uniref:Polysaccharide deacetylase family protein n=1 Tax=Sulfuriferula multivorans TaxID=1559896 RepID=A0A7C9KAJ3_9PROT|nr:polysaccharide deacetylase family protein [Sulfuriferula multivorans]